MGDTVNLAARLESANKSFGTSVLFSESTWSHAGRPAFARKIGRIRVAGREESLVVYSLPPDDANANIIQRFGQALELAELPKFADARAIFEEIAQADPAAALWAERLGAFGKRSSAGELVLELQK